MRGTPLSLPSRSQTRMDTLKLNQARHQDQQYAEIIEKLYEGIYIKEDSDILLELCHEVSSKDLFAHISKHRNDEAERRKYWVTFEASGHTYYDSPYAMKFNPLLIYRELKRSELSPKGVMFEVLGAVQGGTQPGCTSHLQHQVWARSTPWKPSRQWTHSTARGLSCKATKTVLFLSGRQISMNQTQSKMMP